MGARKQASQAFLLHSRGHALLPPLPQPSNKLFQACKILGCYSPAHNPQRGQGLGPTSGNPPSIHRAQMVLVKLDGGNRLAFWATIHRSWEQGGWSGPLHGIRKPRAGDRVKGGVVREDKPALFGDPAEAQCIQRDDLSVQGSSPLPPSPGSVTISILCMRKLSLQQDLALGPISPSDHKSSLSPSWRPLSTDTDVNKCPTSFSSTHTHPGPSPSAAPFALSSQDPHPCSLPPTPVGHTFLSLSLCS